MRIGFVVALACLPALLAQTASAEVMSLSDAKTRQWVSCAAGAAAGGLLANKAASMLGGKLGKTEKLAVTGAGALAGCAIANKFSAQDNQKVASNEVAAAQSGESSKTWTNDKGEKTTVSSVAEPVQVAGAPEAKCKAVKTEYSLGNRRESAQSKQVYCADANGEYKEAGLVL